MEEVGARISDGRVLALIEADLKADILDGLAIWTPNLAPARDFRAQPILLRAVGQCL